MDILQIKKKITEWQNSISKQDNYKLIMVIKEIISLYPRLDNNQKDLFLSNFKMIQKKIFDNIYSNDPVVRRYVVNLALLLNTNELVPDVTKYLKIEKDYENIMVYLNYLEKFKVVGFVDLLLDFLKQTVIPLSVRFKTFVIILSLLNNYKGNSAILDYIFDEIQEVIRTHGNFKYSLLSTLYRSLIESSISYYIGQEIPKVISIFVNYYNTIFFKTIDLIKCFHEVVDDEEKSETLAYCTVFAILVKFLLTKVEYTPTIESKENWWFKFDLHNFLIEIFKNVRSKDYFLSFILSLLREYKLQENFSKFFEDNRDFIDTLIGYLDPDKPRLSIQILYFLSEIELTLSQDNLKNISDFCKHVFDENIVLLCLDIFDRNNYYENLLYFIKYKSTYSEKIKLKIKSMIQKMVRNGSVGFE
ncbi:MAG: hypothetical protein N2657_01330 [bacterium]|nr:hypothetical protein [bacterium]